MNEEADSKVPKMLKGKFPTCF